MLIDWGTLQWNCAKNFLPCLLPGDGHIMSNLLVWTQVLLLTMLKLFWLILYLSQGWKRWFFKALVFYGFLKNQKNLERSDFLFFLDIVFFINYELKPYSYYFFIIIWFSIYMNLYFTVFTLHSLCQYIVCRPTSRHRHHCLSSSDISKLSFSQTLTCNIVINCLASVKCSRSFF